MTGAWKFSVTPFFCVGIYQLVKRGPHTQQYYHSFQLDALHYAQCSYGFEYQKVLVKVNPPKFRFMELLRHTAVLK